MTTPSGWSRLQGRRKGGRREDGGRSRRCGTGRVKGDVDHDPHRVGEGHHGEVALPVETDRPRTLTLVVLDELQLENVDDVRRNDLLRAGVPVALGVDEP